MLSWTRKKCRSCRPKRYFNAVQKTADIDQEQTLELAVSEALLEPIDPAAAIQNFLFACVEGMALRANLNQDVLSQGRLGLDDVPTTTGRLDWTVAWMDISFHVISSL